MKYTIIQADSAEELEELIKKELESGSTLVGGVPSDTEVWENERKGGQCSSTTYLQAVMRKE